MSCGNGYCESDCSALTTGCSTFESQIGLCGYQSGVRCTKRTDCGGFRPSGSAATGACPGPCQCAEEEIWNSNVPPKPNCNWLNNFAELRRQWSDHGRQLSCKCCNCRSCKPTVPCRPCLPVMPSCSTSILPPADRQGSWNDCTLDDKCSNAELRSIENPCVDNVPLPQDCGANAVKAYPMSCSPRNLPDSCQPCASLPKPILKKRSCCQCPTESCSCQPMPRNCNCPPPVQVDVRTADDCTCECPSSPECACPPSERRLARSKVRCPNARLCCPFPRPSPGIKCCCPQCQPCQPQRCDPCAPSKCRPVTPRTNSCRTSSPCVSRSPCRPSPVRVSCQKMTPACYAECERDGKRARSADRTSFCRGRTVGDGGTSAEASKPHISQCKHQRKSGSPGSSVLMKIMNISHSALVPGPLTVLSLVLLIFIAVTCSSGITMYRRYVYKKKHVCWRY